jgi:hypothetical protein
VILESVTKVVYATTAHVFGIPPGLEPYLWSHRIISRLILSNASQYGSEKFPDASEDAYKDETGANNSENNYCIYFPSKNITTAML